jgi:hypothetical protein
MVLRPDHHALPIFRVNQGFQSLGEPIEMA